jgi:hypothetical protein
MKSFIRIALIVCTMLITTGNKAHAQVPEIGFSLILSGAIMFGPHAGYRINDHHYVDVSVLGAWEGKFLFPFAINGSYNYYIGTSSWRPKLGLQYTKLMAPGDEGSGKKYKTFTMISLMPGVEYQTGDIHQKAELQAWIAYFISNKRIAPVAIEGRYGYKF